MHQELVGFAQDIYQTKGFIPLHAPSFIGNEKQYVENCIKSTFVSSVGRYVDEFELLLEQYTKSKKVIAVVNGTAALHTALYMVGVGRDDLVLTQALSFVATCNAIHHMGAQPVFIDVSLSGLGMCPQALKKYLEENGKFDDRGYCIHKKTGQYFKAVLPVHTFGHPVELDKLQTVCNYWNISLVEDAAESLGSFYKGRHTGTYGDFSAISFNGNKIITTGGGGAVLCQDEALAAKTKHLTTTAKVTHPWEYYHDLAGFNYRMPNLNAALGCAQMEFLSTYVHKKRFLASQYCQFFDNSDLQFVLEPQNAISNYWLNAVICNDLESRDKLLKATNEQGVMTRPVWHLMHQLPMYNKCFRGCLKNSEWLADRLVNIPSSVPEPGVVDA